MSNMKLYNMLGKGICEVENKMEELGYEFLYATLEANNRSQVVFGNQEKQLLVSVSLQGGISYMATIEVADGHPSVNN